MNNPHLECVIHETAELKSLDRYKQWPHTNMERKTERELPWL